MSKFMPQKFSISLKTELPTLPVGDQELMIPYSPGRSRFLSKSMPSAKERRQSYVRAAVLLVVFFAAFHFMSEPFGVKGAWMVNLIVYSWLTLTLIPLWMAPTHIQLGAQGMRFHWLIPLIGLITSPWLEWQNIKSMNYQERTAISQTLRRWFDRNNSSLGGSVDIDIDVKAISIPQRAFWNSLCALLNLPFGSLRKGTKLSLMPDAIIHEDDVPKFTRALEYFAGDKCRLDLLPQKISSTQKTFTKLWLENLRGKDGAESDAHGELPPGERLLDGEYTVVAQIGAGGQAIIYRAAHIRSDGATEFVALKEFFLPVRGGMEIRKRALQNVEHEALLLQSLDHPKIVRFIDTFAAGARAYLVTELVDGISLRKYVQQHGAIEEHKCRDIGMQMCQILSYLHGQNPPIIHRDFTPDNLLLKSDGSVVLIDFNVAERLESQAAHTVVGKQCYISPEQFRGHANAQTDVYALGCVLFWALVGRDPQPISVSHPRDDNSKVSAELDHIVARATSLNPADRFAEADEVLDAIAAISLPAMSAELGPAN